ncbi:hypothetical protein F132_44 [Flavobacterium sp. phage 1/32]|nr:hypothetical protein F132_44 [Flavobacterium sp. phage 1/32]
MKTYFILRNFLEESLNSYSVGIAMKSYKIGGLQTLTNQFFVDNQVVAGYAPTAYYFCGVQSNGTNPVPSLDPLTVNSYNPFSKHLGTKYPLVNGLMRGLPIGTLNGNDYGQGVLNIGVDLPTVLTGSNGFLNGAFFIEIDYTKDLYIEFDIITNVINNELFEEPQILRKYKIIWDVKNCYREFSYYSFQTGQDYQDAGLGFLKGETKERQDPFIDFSQIPCGGEGEKKCDDKERTRSFALFIDIPKIEDEVETIKECCYSAEVFAQAEGNDYEKNDFTGVWHKKQVPSETAEFVLVNLATSDEYDLNDNSLGVYKNFGSITDNPNLKTFILQWKKVLLAYGEGVYTIVKRVSIAGVDYEESNINYTLKTYSVKRADKTVRIDIATNGLMERLKVDFINSGFTTSLRFGGFFGRREPKYEEDNIVYSTFVSEQISMMQTNEYTLQSNLLPSCMTQPIIDFMLFANDIYMNDYNLNNHLRDFIKFPVKFSDNKGTNYFSTTTKANLNLTFSDKKVDNIKRNY